MFFPRHPLGTKVGGVKKSWVVHSSVCLFLTTFNFKKKEEVKRLTYSNGKSLLLYLCYSA